MSIPVAATRRTEELGRTDWAFLPHLGFGEFRSASVLFDAYYRNSDAAPAADLTWRPGPFHRALTALPVTFPKSPPWSINAAPQPQQSQSRPQPH